MSVSRLSRQPTSSSAVPMIDHVLTELLATERTYVDALTLLVTFVPLLREHLVDIGISCRAHVQHRIHVDAARFSRCVAGWPR